MSTLLTHFQSKNCITVTERIHSLEYRSICTFALSIIYCSVQYLCAEGDRMRLMMTIVFCYVEYSMFTGLISVQSSYVPSYLINSTIHIGLSFILSLFHYLHLISYTNADFPRYDHPQCVDPLQHSNWKCQCYTILITPIVDSINRNLSLYAYKSNVRTNYNYVTVRKKNVIKALLILNQDTTNPKPIFSQCTRTHFRVTMRVTPLNPSCIVRNSTFQISEIKMILQKKNTAVCIGIHVNLKFCKLEGYNQNNQSIQYQSTNSAYSCIEK